MNVNEIPKEKYNLINKEQIKDTPFTLIKTEKGYFITMGDYRLTEIKETRNEAIKIIQEKTWDLIMTVVLAINDFDRKQQPNGISTTR